jgi:hypothetical protein
MRGVNMPEFSRVNKVLRAAADSGVDQAIADYGYALSAREATGLKQLSDMEIKQLTDLHETIFAIAGGGSGEGIAAPWVCGIAC